MVAAFLSVIVTTAAKAAPVLMYYPPRTIRLCANNGMYPLASGNTDNDFGGRGPDVGVQANLQVSTFSNRNLEVYISGYLDEVGNNSTIFFLDKTVVLATPPAGTYFTQIWLPEQPGYWKWLQLPSAGPNTRYNIGPEFDHYYRDTDTTKDVFNFTSMWYTRLEVMGDTTGDDWVGSCSGTGSYVDFFIDGIYAVYDNIPISPLTFSANGTVAGKKCTSLNESRDAAGGWGDNYLCANNDVGLRWSSAGPIGYMRCTQIIEPAEPASTTWTDNWLCVPPASGYQFTWSYAGIPAAPAGGWRGCVNWNEPNDPHTWGDNWLCY